MVADTFIKARDNRQLYGKLQIHPLTGMGFENCLNELTVQCVEERVHVFDCRCCGGIVFGKRIDG